MHTSRYRKPGPASGRRLWPLVSFSLLGIICLLALAGCGAANGGTSDDNSIVVLPTPTPGVSQPVSLQAIHMIDDKNGWAVTPDGHVLHTTQGVAQWKDITPTAGAPQPTFSTATFLDAQNAWIAGQVNDKISIWRTYTGGDLWLESPLAISGQGVININFIDPLHGWLLLKNGASKPDSEPVAILSTTDGGNNWYQIDNASQSSSANLSALPANNEKTGISFKSTTQGWVTGYTAEQNTPIFYASTDAGYTWTVQPLTLPGKSAIRTFPPVFFGQNDGILPAQLVDNSHAVVIYNTHDGGKTWKSNPVASDITTTVSFINANQGWAVGSNNNGGNIYNTNDGGKSWHRGTQLGGDVVTIESLQFVSAGNGWAIGTTKAGTIQLYQSTDGGKSWAVVKTSATS
ncbi:WD40/YVTN/BNR-like repeat-containing protein [Dictyobacter formicarum]|uniref:Photosynthesis system II assembly factor Ycf48/Hcf136-like domain-containing protein n=1 Tax=Dictyobacter formicarum TaxID=2778368 RepID=A0ABQ3VRJ2_9CHLR|nr:YCF48-related protein [Dictyobacter formicarum]GHO88780.1 hypothetical protein KSZ_67860 [Dictyobacter formicarum]